MSNAIKCWLLRSAFLDIVHNVVVVVVVSDRHTSSVSPYRYPESRDEQKPGPERRDCEAFVIPPKGLMQ